MYPITFDPCRQSHVATLPLHTTPSTSAFAYPRRRPREGRFDDAMCDDDVASMLASVVAKSVNAAQPRRTRLRTKVATVEVSKTEQ